MSIRVVIVIRASSLISRPTRLLTLIYLLLSRLVGSAAEVSFCLLLVLLLVIELGDKARALRCTIELVTLTLSSGSVRLLLCLESA